MGLEDEKSIFVTPAPNNFLLQISRPLYKFEFRFRELALLGPYPRLGFNSKLAFGHGANHRPTRSLFSVSLHTLYRDDQKKILFV